MNLSTAVASSQSSSSLSTLSRSRKVYTVNDHATSSSTSSGGPRGLLGLGSCQNEKRPKRRRRFQKRQRSSFGSSASASSSSSAISKSTLAESETGDPGLFLYEITSQNCPCEHHRTARLRESKSKSNSENNFRISEDNENFIDSFIVNNFEASVAPMRGFLTSTASSNGDSGINTNSNGSQRSSARGYYNDNSSNTRSSRAFSLSSSSSNSASNSASDIDEGNDKIENENYPKNPVKPQRDKEVTTTTVILENFENGCEDPQHLKQNKKHQNWCGSWYEQPASSENNKGSVTNNTISQKNTKPYQISPENDPSNNWTLIKVDNPIQGGSEQMTSIQEEEFDSLFSSPSLKTSHSSSHKELCTCLGGQISDQDLTVQPRGHRHLTRMASYPKCHPDYDPHRFDLKPQEATADIETVPVVGLRQLPNIPPTSYFWQQEKKSNTQPRRQSVASSTTSDFHKRPSRTYSHNNFSAISTSPDMIRHALDIEAAGNHDEIPPCVRNVILQQLQSPRPPSNPKMIKKLSKTINLPDDPSDPTAFTVFHDQHLQFYNIPKYKSRSKSSRQVAKIVGTFSFLMTMGIIILVLCLLYWSDTFKPMSMM